MHRCPGWAGGGTRHARRDRCDDGRLVGGHDGTLYEGRFWWLRFNRCDRCDVLVLPYVVRYVDYRWWSWQVQALRWPLERRLWWPIEDRWLRWRHRGDDRD